MMQLIMLPLLILCAFSATAHSCPTSYSHYIKNLNTYLQDDITGLDNITKEFNTCYLLREALDDGTLLHLEYLRNVAYMTGEHSVIADAKHIFLTLSASEGSQEKYKKLLDIALLYRDFDFARAIKDKYTTDREIPPNLTYLHPRNLLVNTDNGRQWIGFTFPEGGHIVVVGNEFCAFSHAFHQFLQTAENTNPLLAKKVTWISPIDLEFETGTLINDIYRTAEWPEIDVWETPSIYFYYNGKLVSKMLGWPNTGKRDEFLAHLSEIGLTMLPEQ